MPLIGIRELRERATQVLRQVREEGTEYIITYQGRPIALLLPLDGEAVEQAMVKAARETAGGDWATYARVAEELRQAWPQERTAQNALDEVRR